MKVCVESLRSVDTLCLLSNVNVLEQFSLLTVGSFEFWVLGTSSKNKNEKKMASFYLDLRGQSHDVFQLSLC
jgi:hypothetical protein